MDIKEIRKKRIDAEFEIEKVISKFEKETGLEINSVLYERKQTNLTSGFFPPVINRFVKLEIFI